DGSQNKVVRPAIDNVGDWAAGFLHSTARELARFTIAFMNNGVIDKKQVLDPDVIQHMSSPQIKVPESINIPRGFWDDLHYGYGQFIAKRNGLTLVHHIGVIDGFFAMLLMVPAKRVSVVLLANREFSTMGGLTSKALDLAGAGGTPSEPPEAAP